MKSVKSASYEKCYIILRLTLMNMQIGNPLLEFVTDMNSPDQYYWSHGLISDSAYELLISLCNSSRFMGEAIRNSFSPECLYVYSVVEEERSKSIDKYDVAADVCLASGHLPTSLLTQSLQSQAHHHGQGGVKVDPCIENKATKYLNRKDVQKALQAKLVGITSWNLCNK